MIEISNREKINPGRIKAVCLIVNNVDLQRKGVNMILDEIVARKKERLSEYKRVITESQMKDLAAVCEREPIRFYEALQKKGLSIIGEFKNASPSHGTMENKLSLPERIGQYDLSMDAISCLTEEDYFKGNVEYFKTIRELSTLPMLRKDFIIDPYQVFEARVIGADCILLIAAILSDRELQMFYELAGALELDVLLEVHNEEEMKRAIGLEADIIGINNRNLCDFSVDLNTTERLSQMLPEETLLVSESGITGVEDIRALQSSRVNAVLIGTVFMESENPRKLAEEWKAAFSD